MLKHFTFAPLCQHVAKHDHISTTNVLAEVNCEGCLEIVDGIAKQAGIVRPSTCGFFEAWWDGQTAQGFKCVLPKGHGDEHSNGIKTWVDVSPTTKPSYENG